MRLRRSSPLLLPSILLLIPTLAAAININCEHFRVDEKSFYFQELDGPHSVMRSEKVSELSPNLYNTTFTINICQALKKTKNVPKKEDCPNGSRVCGIKRLVNTAEDKVTVVEAIPIAGEYKTSIGGSLNPFWKRLKTSESSSDRDKEGLRLSMEGGSKKDKQKAVVDFLCPTKKEERKRLRRDKDGKEDDDEEDDTADSEEVDDGAGGRLKFVKYEAVEDVMVLNLEWTTKYACEDAKEDGGKKDSSGHWGFFTWLIIIFFLGTAAYLIFGSWLNYNRYSARGWDLLPHSETIRDIPYLLRDWMRRVVNTIQGGGSRGGYSAV